MQPCGRVTPPLLAALALAVLLLPLQVTTGQYSTDEIVDLTLEMVTNDTLYWPEWPYSYERLDVMDTKGDGYWATAYGFKMAIHTGTHIDVPCHVRATEDGGLRMHEIPIERFFGPGCVIDIAEKVDGDRDYRMVMEDVEAWEEEHGRIPDGAVVLVHTGWAKKYGDNPEEYWGTMDMTKPELLSYPSIHPDVANFFVNERNINAVGMDAGTPDAPGEAGSHLALLGKERIIIENIAATLDQVPPTGYRIHIVPLKLHDTCGAPVRLLAFREPESASGSTRIHGGGLSGLVFVLGILSVWFR